MTLSNKDEKRLIEIRRGRVLQLMSEGHTVGSEIAQILNVSEPTISRDLTYLENQAAESLKSHIQTRIPLTVNICYVGYQSLIKRSYDILDNTPNLKPTEKTEIIKLISYLYEQIQEFIA